MTKQKNKHRYTEKLVCKKCKDIFFRQAEIEELPMNVSLEDNQVAYGVIIKQHTCVKCGSTEFNSTLIDGKVENVKDGVISAVLN